MEVRDAEAGRDAAACAAIYAPHVTGGLATFEYEAPSAEDFATRIDASHAWLVAVVDREVAGYAYASPHMERAAYAWSANVAVYVADAHERRGVGRALYAALIERCRSVGLRMLCAGVTQPNPGSSGLHEAMGFEAVGVYRKIGWKAGAWHDVRWYQLDLAPGDESEPGPAP